jgi:hypothetical protein
LDFRSGKKILSNPLAGPCVLVYLHSEPQNVWNKAMKRLLLLLTVTFGLVSQPLLAAETPRGNLLELHSCELYAGGCTVSSEATQGGRYMLRLWDFTGGTFNGTDFQGLRLAVLQSSPDNLAASGSKPGEAVLYLPQSATAIQREALAAWVKSSQPDFSAIKLQSRVVPFAVVKTDTGYAFSAGSFVSVSTRSLEKCESGSCGEALWYEPRTPTSVFTVAVNNSSQVNEPLLKLTWVDSAKRSVFLGHFGEPATATEVFVTMNELCGFPKSFF